MREEEEEEVLGGIMAAVRIGSSAVPIFIPEQALQVCRLEGLVTF